MNVTQFLDHRTFLRSYVQQQKDKNPSWSMGQWAKRLGLANTASLTRIINGDRQPGPAMVEKFIHYFKFNPQDAEYFRDLIKLDKIRHDKAMALILMEKMGKRYPHGSVKIMDEKTFSTISNWYYGAIYELIRLPGCGKITPDKISELLQFKVTVAEVCKALNTLCQLNLLALTEEGSYTIAEGRLDTSDDVASEAIKRFHEQMMENAKMAIRSISVDKREFSSAGFVFNSKKMDDAKKLIRDFESKFYSLMEDPVDGDVVYQLQFQFFPMTKEVKHV